MKKQEIYSEALDWIEVIAGGAPDDFPSETGLTLSKVFMIMENYVLELQKLEHRETSLKWLSFAKPTVEKAYSAYTQKKDDEAYRYMNEVRDLLRDAKKGRVVQTTFVVGPDGRSEKL